MRNTDRPIIIVKKKGGHGGHHGGAWKIAYADLVTAMMAFFMVMWLLSTAEEPTKQAIARYFRDAPGVFDPLPNSSENIVPRGGLLPEGDSPKDLKESVRQDPGNIPAHPRDQKVRIKRKYSVEKEVSRVTEESEESDAQKFVAALSDAAMQADPNEFARLQGAELGSGAVDGEDALAQDLANAFRQVAEKTEEPSERVIAERLAESMEEASAVVDDSAEIAEQEFLNEAAGEAAILQQLLTEEIESGQVEVEVTAEGLVIRINEAGSFASGSVELVKPVEPLIETIGGRLKGLSGEIVVSGHTDNQPISTGRFRSNWELSSSRAVTLVQKLTQVTALPNERFRIEGYGDTKPLANNDTAEGRAKNRRVEILVRQKGRLLPPGERTRIASGASAGPIRRTGGRRSANVVASKEGTTPPANKPSETLDWSPILGERTEERRLDIIFGH